MTDERQKQGQLRSATVPAGDDAQDLSPKGTSPSRPGGGSNVPGAHAEGEGQTAASSELGDPVAAAEARAEEHLADLQRLAAEFDNYRKRVTRDQQLLATRASERLLRELLPVVDDLERALEAAEQHEEAKLEEGVRLVHRALADVLRRQGLEEIEADGRFDPHVHEALLSQPSEQEEGAVIQVAQKGYRLGDLVLRPARVVVSAGSSEGS